MSPAPERIKVRLLDRMSPTNDLTQTADLASTTRSQQSSCAGEDSDTQASTFTPTPTPMNPTPPRTRRGSWIFKKSREQRHPQRARSNSVPTVMDLTQLSLWQQQLADRASCHIPDIIVSGENTAEEDDDCFNGGGAAAAAAEAAGRRKQYRSLEDRLQRLAQSNESLLSDDVVEGFSYTMAETIIEDIMKDIGSKRSNLSVSRSGNGRAHPPVSSKRKMPGKGILKLSSNDSLNRSHSGSLDRPDGCPPSPNVKVVSGGDVGGGGGGGDKSDGGGQPMSWSQRSTSMPSLRAIDELETLSPTSSFYGASEGDSSGGGQVSHDQRNKIGARLNVFHFFAFLLLARLLSLAALSLARLLAPVHSAECTLLLNAFHLSSSSPHLAAFFLRFSFCRRTRKTDTRTDLCPSSRETGAADRHTAEMLNSNRCSSGWPPPEPALRVSFTTRQDRRPSSR